MKMMGMMKVELERRRRGKKRKERESLGVMNRLLELYDIRLSSRDT